MRNAVSLIVGLVCIGTGSSIIYDATTGHPRSSSQFGFGVTLVFIGALVVLVLIMTAWRERG